MSANQNRVNIWQEREDAVVRNVMSGNNACGTLRKALESGKLEDFLRTAVRPALLICAGEQAELRKQRDDALAASEARRQILAEVAANVCIPARLGELADRVERAARATG
jgi:hypothetical protein